MSVAVGELDKDFVGVPFLCRFTTGGLVELEGEWMGNLALAAESLEVIRVGPHL